MTTNPLPKVTVRVGSRFTLNGRPLVVAPQGDKGSAIRNGSVWLMDVAREGQEPLGGELYIMTLLEMGGLYQKGSLVVA